MNIRLFPLLLVCSFLIVSVPLAAQMSDSEVLNYVKKGVASGKDVKQLGSELLSRGVSEQQIQRLYDKYKGNSSSVMNSPEGLKGTKFADRSRSYSANGRDTSERKTALIENIPVSANSIFGQDIFNAGGVLSFEPNDNIATPADYILGPGDEIIIDVWGASDETIRQTISPDGQILIPQIGPVQLSGLSLSNATGKLKRILSQKYSLGEGPSDSQISVTIGNIRSIQVNVLGEVRVPGTYRLSAFANVFHAIYRAGGITPVGSLRKIDVVRGGKTIGSADLYSYIFDGDSDVNFSLKEGDVIIVPPYSALVEVKGGVKRPMLYESKDGECLDKLIRYSGDFVPNASKDNIVVERQDGKSAFVYTVDAKDFHSFSVKDGDIVTVISNNYNDLFENRVEIQGSILLPGTYSIDENISGVRSLVTRAGGLLEDAYLNRAQIIRELPDRSKETIAIAIGSIMDGTSPDIRLQKNDSLVVFNKHEVEPRGDFSITGYVKNPGNYPFSEGTTIEDLILMAGGLQSGASTARVEVSRRIFDPEGTEVGTKSAEIFCFGLKEGMYVDGKPDFTLKPYDIVYIRKSPTFIPQQQVRVSGEVVYPGEYSISSSNERLSDLFKRAGGAIPTSYIDGAILKRRFTNEEKDSRDALMQTADNKRDSLNVLDMIDADSYSVGINLSKALSMPGSDYDVVLCEGDELIVPTYSGIVKIEGEIQYPNAVSFINGENVAYYIEQAGGFSKKARRGGVYVVYVNGTIEKGAGAKVEPGSVIMVPARNERSKTTLAEWLSLGTTAASLTTMVATIANLFK